MTPAPVLRTARLVLRPFREDDLAAYTAIRAVPENVRFLPGGEAGAAEAPARARACPPCRGRGWVACGGATMAI